MLIKVDEKLDRKKIEEKIINFLKQSSHGATGSEIAKFLGLNRVTVSKYLDVLRAEGLIDYKQIGRTKIWFLNEDIAILELIRSEKDLIKFIRKRDYEFLLGNEIHIVFAPIELISNIYTEILKKADINTVKSIGKKLGKQYVYLYELYSGTKLSEIPRKNLESVITQIIKFFLRKGWGKLKDIIVNVVNVKRKELIVVLEDNIVYEALKEIEDPALEEYKNKPICHLLTGFFEGVMEGIFNKEFIGIESKCKNKGDNFCSFYIKEKI